MKTSNFFGGRRIDISSPKKFLNKVIKEKLLKVTTRVGRKMIEIRRRMILGDKFEKIIAITIAI